MGKDFVNSNDGQNLKDDALNKAADAANGLTGGRFEDQINQDPDAASGAFSSQQEFDQEQY